MNSEIITTLANATISLLSSFLVQGFAKKAGETVGEGVGQKAFEKVLGLYNTIKERFSGNAETKKILDKFEKFPQDSDIKSVMRFHMIDMFESDPLLVNDIANKLKQASDSGADAVFHTTVTGDVKNLVQASNVFGDINLS